MSKRLSLASKQLITAGAYERWGEFIDAVDRQPAAPAATSLLIQAGPLAANLEERTDTGVSSGALTKGGRERLIFAGQQAYIDYRLGMVAKIDALELCRPPAFCALVEYDSFASDRLFSCTDLQRVDAGTAKRLTLRSHPRQARLRQKGSALRSISGRADAGTRPRRSTGHHHAYNARGARL